MKLLFSQLASQHTSQDNLELHSALQAWHSIHTVGSLFIHFFCASCRNTQECGGPGYPCSDWWLLERNWWHNVCKLVKQMVLATVRQFVLLASYVGSKAVWALRALQLQNCGVYQSVVSLYELLTVHLETNWDDGNDRKFPLLWLMHFRTVMQIISNVITYTECK